MGDLMGCKAAAEKIDINERLKFDEESGFKEEEVIGIKEENLRLKTLLQKIEEDYKNLQMKLIDFQQEAKKNGSSIPSGDDGDQELVSLRLGTSSTDSMRDTSDHSTDRNGVVKVGSDDHPAMSRNEGLPPSKSAKTQRNRDDEISQTSVKRARVCVRARCDTPTMNDGCQWRKYGQKIAKANPCPRAYYRCTISPSCPVRKQVEDTSILITTYEGTHNHPLPISATAMASTTSAAASMLLSGSSASQPSATAAAPLNLYGQLPPPYFMSNSSSNSSPTITLDLITNPSQTSNTAFSLYSSTSPTNPRFPTTNLSFSSMDSNTVPTIWGGGYHPFLQQQKFESLCIGNPNPAPLQQGLTDTLTKVISSDPSFRSAIAAVISTMAANGRKMDGDMKGENMAAADSSSLS